VSKPYVSLENEYEVSHKDLHNFKVLSFRQKLIKNVKLGWNDKSQLKSRSRLQNVVYCLT
jgi:hypothetical protein